jgi:D-tyrosyl-tRNA(Tyr) deacylase
MIAVVQRVLEASVRVEGQTVGQIAGGLVALVAVCAEDAPADVEWMARKLIGLRVFRNSDKHFDLDVKQSGGSILLISNFTVAAETRPGRRPSFDPAADPQQAAELFTSLIDAVRSTGIPTQTGQFGADMQVHLTNDGPATFILDSADGRK